MAFFTKFDVRVGLWVILVITAGAFLNRAIGFMRLDGSDIRFLAHSYNEFVDYWKIPRAMIAPNGKLVVFDSEFRGAGGGDVYVVETPLR